MKSLREYIDRLDEIANDEIARQSLLEKSVSDDDGVYTLYEDDPDANRRKFLGKAAATAAGAGLAAAGVRPAQAGYPSYLTTASDLIRAGQAITAYKNDPEQAKAPPPPQYIGRGDPKYTHHPDFIGKDPSKSHLNPKSDPAAEPNPVSAKPAQDEGPPLKKIRDLTNSLRIAGSPPIAGDHESDIYIISMPDPNPDGLIFSWARRFRKTGKIIVTQAEFDCNNRDSRGRRSPLYVPHYTQVYDSNGKAEGKMHKISDQGKSDMSRYGPFRSDSLYGVLFRNTCDR